MNTTGTPTSESSPPVPTVGKKDENMWAMLCHLTTLSGFIIPLANIIAPLIIWSMKKDEFPLVEDQGKEALNFQISMTIYCISAAILIFIIIGIPLLIGLAIFDIIVTIIAAVKTNEGSKYRYPLAIRLIK
jgi:uncharacterized Tic20 family protein